MHHDHDWLHTGHIANVRIYQCQGCWHTKREQDAPGDTLSQRIRSGYFRQQTLADPDTGSRSQASVSNVRARPEFLAHARTSMSRNRRLGELLAAS